MQRIPKQSIIAGFALLAGLSFLPGGADATHGWVRTAALATANSSASTSTKLRIIGTPSVRYRIVKDARLGRYVSIEAVLRLNRSPGSSSQRAITAPTLRSGQELPQQIFGGATLRTLLKDGPCYVGEISQLRQRTGVSDRTWRLGLFSKGEVVTTPQRVTLKRDAGDDWQRAAGRRLGC